MITSYEFGSSPVDEDCAQVGSEDYEARARKECAAWKNQLCRHLHEKGILPENHGVKFKIKKNSHDFGSYYEVAAYFDSDDGVASDIVYELEASCPTNWDDEAKKELET